MGYSGARLGQRRFACLDVAAAIGHAGAFQFPKRALHAGIAFLPFLGRRDQAGVG